MQPDDSGEGSGVLARLAQLDADELDALVELAQQRANGSISRRGILQAGAAIGGGALLGGGAVGSASADASASDGDPDVGSPSTPVDVFGDGIDANTIGSSSNRVSDIYGDSGDFNSVSTERQQTTQLSVSLDKTSNQSIGNDTEDTIQWDSADVDAGLYSWDSSTYEITVLESGDFSLDAGIQATSINSGDAIQFKVYLNDSVERAFRKQATDTQAFINGGVGLKDLADGDIIKFIARFQNGGTLQGSDFSYCYLSRDG